jgi:hypothetical protein
MKRVFSSMFLTVLLILTSSGTFAQLRINEFLASNDASFPGPQGDYPDWIEVYNAGSVAVNMAGYWISDDLNEPDKLYQIPSTNPALTTVQPGGFILFIANGDPTGGVLNVNFKLSGSGEHIGLWMPDKETVVDTMSFGAQTTDVSMGLSPNGGELWYFFNSPTPGASNPDYTGITENTGITSICNIPNPCNTFTRIEFELTVPSEVIVNVYDMMGNLVEVLSTGNYSAGKHYISWNTSALRESIYYCKVSTAIGSTTRKVIVNH